MYDAPVPTAKSRKAARHSSQGTIRHAPEYAQPLQHPMYQQAHTPYYPVHSAGYVFEASPEAQNYLLPYTQFQHIPHPNAMRYHPAVQGRPHAIASHNPAAQFPQYMPPLKRPRTELKYGPVHHNGSSRHASNSAKSTPTKAKPNHKTFSDFRISKIKIGSFESHEEKEDSQARDSKVRFCFRNPSDKDPPSTSSATEAALMTPDRISISLCKGTQRIVVPAYHIKSVDFRRTTGEITICTDGWAAFETSTSDEEDLLEDSVQNGQEGSPPKLTPRWRLTESDITNGQLSVAKKIEIKLDMNKPLTEPKWTRGNLEDHIDSSSRFLHIMNITDAAGPSTFQYFVDRWAGDDTEKAYYCEYQLKAPQLLELLTSLMSMSNILTPAITYLVNGMLAMVEEAKLPAKEIAELLKTSLLLIPPHMLTKALDVSYAAFESAEEVWGEPQLQIGYSYGGAKRQRGESEVPSDQLAKTTLDEKRRRLSDSEHQHPDEVSRNQQQTHKKRGSTNATLPSAIPMQASKSEELIVPAPLTPLPSKSRRRSEETSSAGSGARLSREELLRNLEDFEGQDSSSDHERDTEATPIEATNVHGTGLSEEWPPLGSETLHS